MIPAPKVDAPPMDNELAIVKLYRVISVIVAVGSAATVAFAGCPPNSHPYMTTGNGNETVVHCGCDMGYTLNSGRCVASGSKTEYAQCIRSVGELAKKDRGNCAYRVQRVFNDASPGLSESALGCLLGSLANGLTPYGVLGTCGLAAIYPTQVLEHAVQEMNSCFLDVLTSQRQRAEQCSQQ